MKNDPKMRGYGEGREYPPFLPPFFAILPVLPAGVLPAGESQGKQRGEYSHPLC